MLGLPIGRLLDTGMRLLNAGVRLGGSRLLGGGRLLGGRCWRYRGGLPSGGFGLGRGAGGYMLYGCAALKTELGGIRELRVAIWTVHRDTPFSNDNKDIGIILLAFIIS